MSRVVEVTVAIIVVLIVLVAVRAGRAQTLPAFHRGPALWGRVFSWLSNLVAGLPGKMRRISEFASIRVLRRTARRRPSLLKVWQPREDPTPFPTFRFQHFQLIQ